MTPSTSEEKKAFHLFLQEDIEIEYSDFEIYHQNIKTRVYCSRRSVNLVLVTTRGIVFTGSPPPTTTFKG